MMNDIDIKIRNLKDTKVVATIGPSSSDINILRQMIISGVNVCRINFSHSKHDDAREIIKTVRELNIELNTNVAILADLQGPKLRLGTVEEGSEIHTGDRFTITTQEQIGNSEKAYITYPDFAKDVNPGEHILLDDGKLMLQVQETDMEHEVKTLVIQGGPLKSKKGVNLPNTNISLPCLTPKDLADLQVALEEKIEWIGLSFVRAANDVKELQRIIKKSNSSAKVIAKIEKPEAIKEIDEIIRVSGGLMVARGDLGVEVPMERVPSLQKMIVKKSQLASKPVIIATQMMESMIESMSPTRAEVNDVANSVYDGADALMLSGETSVGKYPVHVIKAMTKIIRDVETSGMITKPENPPVEKNNRYISNSICYHASKLADQIGAKAILTMTHTGFNAFKISSHRPNSKVCIFTHNRSILNTLSLLWGTRGYYYNKKGNTDDTIADVQAILKAEGVAAPGDYVVNIASMPVEDKGMTNMLKVSVIK